MQKEWDSFDFDEALHEAEEDEEDALVRLCYVRCGPRPVCLQVELDMLACSCLMTT